MHPISTPLVIVLLLFLVSLLPPFPMHVPDNISFSKKKCKHQSNCGVVLNIKPPFRFEGDSQDCGLPGYQLSCVHNHTVLHLHFNKYYVEAIDYRKRRIRVTDPRVHVDNCSTLQGYSLTEINFEPFRYYEPFTLVVFFTCKDLVQSAHYVDAAPCTTAKDFSDSFVRSSDEHSYSYALIGNNLVASDIEDSCCFHNVVAYDYDLHWRLGYGSSFVYFPLEIGGRYLIMFILTRALLGIILLFAFLVYKCRRRHLSLYDNIEEFLQSQNNLMPIRYSYKEIRKMTNNFKDKLGKGGYGDVYKGISQSGHLVAIKMLNEAKGSGQDFINEVATIGRIYHANVVGLVGFRATASKHALVYDYMPNGSLEKFVFSDDPNCIPLSWERTYEIAVGVARGIAYLHQGCNMQILHFDIKPHNVLLDENFVPKLSDFGLAKFYPIEKSAVTLTAVRGTLGYMAPELIYKKIGGVSYKADVYSFGQLLLAMVGRRKLNALTDHSSFYFSSWIYDKVDRAEDEDLDFGDITEDEKKIVRKIVLVALWCVQWTPAERPSVREVLKMLEGDLQNLKLLPKHLYYPPDSCVREQSNSPDTGVSTFPLCESIALEIEQSD